jgi:hypothetical protein
MDLNVEINIILYAWGSRISSERPYNPAKNSVLKSAEAGRGM